MLIGKLEELGCRLILYGGGHDPETTPPTEKAQALTHMMGVTESQSRLLSEHGFIHARKTRRSEERGGMVWHCPSSYFVALTFSGRRASFRPAGISRTLPRRSQPLLCIPA